MEPFLERNMKEKANGVESKRKLHIVKVTNSERDPWWLPIISIGVALAFCGVLITVNGYSPVDVYLKMIKAAFGSSYGIGETLVKAIPLLLCSLGIALASRIRIWNIGAEGQFIAGTIAATWVALYWTQLPSAFVIPAMFGGGCLAGAIWGLLAAIPRAYFQVNEIITTLMLNYVALLFLDYLVYGPWRDPDGFNFPGTAPFSLSAQLITYGTSRLHLGLMFGIIAIILYAVLLRSTRWGYEMRVLGDNPSAAQSAGIPAKRYIVFVMLISGGLAGLAGMSEVAGVTHRLQHGISPGYGYTAIIVAWLAKLNPFGLLISSVLFGGLIVGGYSVQSIGISSSISLMIQGSILFFLIGGEWFGKYRIKWTNNLPNRKQEG